jgi:hypothetical protein
MTKNELAEALRINLYGDRGTDLAAAYQYVNMIHDGLPSDHRPAVGTALHVLVNTIANCIRELPDALPATPEAVTLAPADDPSRGSWSEKELIELIESWFNDNVDIDHAVEEYIENSVDFTEIVRDELRGNLTLTVNVE